MTFQRKKSRLKKVLVIAAALGCSSASLSGALVSLEVQQASRAPAAMA